MRTSVLRFFAGAVGFAAGRLYGMMLARRDVNRSLAAQLWIEEHPRAWRQARDAVEER